MISKTGELLAAIFAKEMREKKGSTIFVKVPIAPCSATDICGEDNWLQRRCQCGESGRQVTAAGGAFGWGRE